jgi:hypothetical protein
MRNFKIDAAVGAALGLGALIAAPLAHAQTLSVATCAGYESTAGTPKLYMGGSSAAQTGFFTNLATNVYGGFANMLLLNGTNSTGNSVTNFQAYCGSAISGNPLNLPVGPALIYYRAEGGSVTGALPIAAGSNPPTNTVGVGTTYKLQELSIQGVNTNSLCGAITAATGTAPNEVTCSIAGTSSSNGTNDSFGPTGLQSTYIDIGITDVEPGLLGQISSTVAGNYPTAYSTTVYGSVTATQLSGLTAIRAFSQTFGFFINNTTFTGGAALDFSADTYRNIWKKGYTNWENVPTSQGVPASTSSVPIILINRENGSGSKSATQAFLYNYPCNTTNSLAKTTSPNTDGWATKEVLVTVGANPGAITYASIDNAGKVSTAFLANMNGLAPTNLLTSTGAWPFWVESFYVENSNAASMNSGNGQDGNGTAATVQAAIFSSYELNVPASNVPHNAQIGVIPGTGGGSAGTIASSDGSVTASGTVGGNGKTIYVNAMTRNGNTCSAYPTAF